MVRMQTGVRKVLDNHDLLFSVGADLFTWSLPSDVEPMPPGMPLIHLDIDPWEIGKNYPAQAAILGDPKAPCRISRRPSSADDGQRRRRGARRRRRPRRIEQDLDALRAKARALGAADCRCSRSRCSMPSARCCRRTPS